MKKIYLASAIALSAFVLHTSAFAFGEKGTWSSGWGQGVSEYTAVNQAGDEIYIACSNMQPVSINLTVNGKSYGSGDDGGFDLILDGKTVQEPYETASRVGSNSFFYAWEHIRKAHDIRAVTTDGQEIVLPSKGSANALPSVDSNAFPCITEF